jgi:rare lipoprotein A
MAFSLLLLASCSGDRETKYWHSGSERPYEIGGIRYYPQTCYQYSAVGYSSWYGYDCHGKPTATGRKFDKNKLTAAHRTLPLPSVVIVENLENGKKVKLLVNDRGPFAYTNKRIIDVSQRASEILGFRKKGSARVRVTCLPKESQLAALQYKRRPYRSRRRR